MDSSSSYAPLSPSSINSNYRSVESNATSISSAGLARRSHAADQLNRTLLFGESERPDDLTEDWCYVSDKNARKRVEHATRYMHVQYVCMYKQVLSTTALYEYYLVGFSDIH